MTNDEQKAAAARAALDFVEDGSVIGVGSGTTVARFVDALAQAAARPRAAVSTSEETTTRLQAAGIAVVPLEDVGRVAVCVDGADEIDPLGRLIKGAGGAHTMEKVVASAADMLVIIADESKLVASLGARAPVPIEVLPEAVSPVTACIEGLGARVTERERRSDHGNVLLDVAGLDLGYPDAMETALDAIPGVVECGIFAARRADVALIGTAAGQVHTRYFTGDGGCPTSRD